MTPYKGWLIARMSEQATGGFIVRGASQGLFEGKVVSVDADTKDIKVGDTVVALTNECFEYSHHSEGLLYFVPLKHIVGVE